MPACDHAEFLRQAPFFGQKPAGLCVIDTKLFPLKIEEIQTKLCGVADDTLVFLRIGNDETKPADIVDYSGSERDIHKSAAGLRNFVGKHCGGYRMLPAASQFGRL